MARDVTIAATTVTMTDSPESVAASFDAVLSKTGIGIQYTLTLTIRINIEQINPDPSHYTSADADGHSFFIRQWNANDWANFVKGLQVQANMWNDKFWLDPPFNCRDYDEAAPFNTFHDQTRGWPLMLRPYIKCMLDVDFSADKATAHKTIRIANIDPDPHRDRFVADSTLYSSESLKPHNRPLKDDQGIVIPESTRHLTVPHEIGHSLGLPHIGILTNAPYCNAAIDMVRAGLNNLLPREAQGGHNSLYCYGEHEKPEIGANVMGAGDRFAKVDAKPWVWAMQNIRGPRLESWKVITSFPGYYYPAPELKLTFGG